MKIALLGNSLAAVKTFDAARDGGHDLFVVCPFGGRQHDWHESLFEHVRGRGVEALFAPENVNHPLFLDEMTAFAPELLVCVYYNQTVHRPMLDLPGIGAINIHPSLLPEHRGSAPLIWAMIEGRSRTGVTIQKMAPELDEGEIVLQRPLEIGPDETGYELHQRAAALVEEMFREFLCDPQGFLSRSRPQHGPSTKRTAEDGLRNSIQWTESARDIYNVIRALAPPLPRAYGQLDGARCLIDRAALPATGPLPRTAEAVPGQLYGSPRDGTVRVRCGDGDIVLVQVTFLGKPMSGADFLELAASRGRRARFESVPPDPASEALALQGAPPISPEVIYFGKPHFGVEEEREVLETLRSGWVGAGERCQAFEKAFAEYVRSPNAVAVSSCTAALHLSLVLLGIGPGQEVITTPLTFAATANVIEQVGATPVFADVDPLTWNLDPESVEARMTDRTAAILPVHFGGLPCDMDRLEKLSRSRSIPIVEDAAHAVGARHRGRPIGNSPNLVCFSFYANKNLACADGGMLCAPREDWASRARSLRGHGMRQDAWARFRSRELILARVLELGFKYNFTDLQAALGLAQLRKLEQMQATRDALAKQYDAQLQGLACLTRQFRPQPGLEERHALHLYAVKLEPERLLDRRNAIVAALRAENIGAGIHYEALHLHPYYRRKYGLGPGTAPVAERICRGVFSLPLSPSMTATDVSTVVKALRRVLEHHGIA